MEEKDYLDKVGLSRFLARIREIFAPTSHEHVAADITDLNDLIGSGGGSGSSGPVSWNDLTDKPFYTELSTEEAFPETEFTLGIEDGMYQLFTPTTAEYEAGWYQDFITATITWDGVEYICEPQIIDGIKYAGNVGSLMNGEDTGEPFILGIIPASMNGGVPYFIAADIVNQPAEGDTESTITHTLSIALTTETVKTLDPKFSPIKINVEKGYTFILSEPASIPFDFNSDDNAYGLQMEPAAEMVSAWVSDWETATVSWDGVDYICEPQYVDGAKAIGNVGLFMGTGDNGMPFIIAVISQYNLAILYDVATVAPEGTTEGTVTHEVGMSFNYPERVLVDPSHISDVDYETMVVNKPFYTTPGGTVLSQGTVSCTNSLDNMYYGLVDKFDIIAGAEYLIDVDGTVVDGGGDGEGDVYVIFSDNLMAYNYPAVFGDATAIILQSPATITYKITTKTDAVKKIDEKYLPDSSGLPDVTTSDNNKVLTVVNGAWAAKTPASGLPTAYTSDNGKVLGVINGVWTKTTVLPTVTTSDNGKLLAVQNGEWTIQTPVSDLPDVSEVDNEKLLTVVGGTWVAQLPASRLPDVTSENNEMILKVSDGEWIVTNEHKELPTVTTDDAGKFLRVDASGCWAVESIPTAEEASF